MKQYLLENCKVSDVSSVEEFARRYYKPDRLAHGMAGTPEQSKWEHSTIAGLAEELAKNGYCWITHHSSITGRDVAYFET